MEKEEAKNILKQTIKEMFQDGEIKVEIIVDSVSASAGYTDLKISVIIDNDVVSESSDSIFTDYQTF